MVGVLAEIVNAAAFLPFPGAGGSAAPSGAGGGVNRMRDEDESVTGAVNPPRIAARSDPPPPGEGEKVKPPRRPARPESPGWRTGRRRARPRGRWRTTALPWD